LCSGVNPVALNIGVNKAAKMLAAEVKRIAVPVEVSHLHRHPIPLTTPRYISQMTDTMLVLSFSPIDD